MKPDYLSGGVHIFTDVYKPTGPANNAAIILAYGSDGLIDNKNGPWATMIREDASDLAQKGFHALVPDYFLISKTPAGTIDYKQDGILTVMAHKDEWQRTIADAVQYAKTLPGIDSSRIGLLGYSLGAYLSLRLRAQAKAVVAFFPPLLSDGIGSVKTPGLPVDVHYGDKDPLDFAHNAGPIAQQLRTDGATVKLHCYPGANHGFSGGELPAASAKARTESRAAMIEFFKTSL